MKSLMSTLFLMSAVGLCVLMLGMGVPLVLSTLLLYIYSILIALLLAWVKKSIYGKPEKVWYKIDLLDSSELYRTLDGTEMFALNISSLCLFILVVMFIASLVL